MCEKVCLIAERQGDIKNCLQKGKILTDGRRGLYNSIPDLIKKIPERIINDIDKNFKIITLDVNENSLLHYGDNYSLLPNSNAVIINVESIKNIIN